MHDPLMRRGTTNMMRSGGHGGSTSRLLPGGAAHGGAGGGPPPRAPSADHLMLQPPPVLHCKKNLQKMGGISPSDIDKYSRILFPTVHFKVHDPSRHCKGSSRENTITRYNNAHPVGQNRYPRRYDEETPVPPVIPCPPAPSAPPAVSVVTPKDINKMFGITASDIDKYSRVIFPITFICFQLMYWIIYQHLSDVVVEDLVFLQKD